MTSPKICNFCPDAVRQFTDTGARHSFWLTSCVRLNKAKESGNESNVNESRPTILNCVIELEFSGGGVSAGLPVILCLGALSHNLVRRTNDRCLRGWLNLTRQSFCRCPNLLHRKHRLAAFEEERETFLGSNTIPCRIQLPYINF